MLPNVSHSIFLGWDSSSSPCVLTYLKCAIFCAWLLKFIFGLDFPFTSQSLLVHSISASLIHFRVGTCCSPSQKKKNRQSRNPLNSVCSCSFAELAQTLWPEERTRGCWPRAPRRTIPRWRTELRTTPFAAASYTRREGT